MRIPTKAEKERYKKLQAKHRKKRLKMKALPIPAFNTPYGGVQCRRCKEWYPKAMFERRSVRGKPSTVKTCQHCISGSDPP